jgi:hypothetical protein
MAFRAAQGGAGGSFRAEPVKISALLAVQSRAFGRAPPNEIEALSDETAWFPVEKLPWTREKPTKVAADFTRNRRKCARRRNYAPCMSDRPPKSAQRGPPTCTPVDPWISRSIARKTAPATSGSTGVHGWGSLCRRPAPETARGWPTVARVEPVDPPWKPARLRGAYGSIGGLSSLCLAARSISRALRSVRGRDMQRRERRICC